MYRLLYDFPCMRTREPTEQLSPGMAARSLLSTFLECAASGNSKLVTAWPRGIDTPAALHQMGVLWHVVGEDGEDEAGLKAAELTSLVTLTWPFTNDTLSKLAGVLAYRRVLQPRNGLHINGHEQCCYPYHIQLRRIGDLNPDTEVRRSGWLSTLREHEELQHPSLAELAPIVVMDTDGTPLMDDCRERFLGRIRKYTLIKEELTPEGLFDLTSTPYIMFGIAPGTDLKKAARIVQIRRPDVVLLDLKAADKCYGDSWPAKAFELLRWVRVHNATSQGSKDGERPHPPVCAIADTPWLAHLFAKEVIPIYQKSTGFSEQVVLNISSDPLSQGIQASSGSRVSAMVVTCLARHLTPYLAEGELLRKALEPLDAGMSELVCEMLHFIRRMICLPGGMDAYDQFLSLGRSRVHFQSAGPLALAARLLELERLGGAGIESGRVIMFVQSFQEALTGLRETTPGNDFLHRLRRAPEAGAPFTVRGNTLLVLPDRATDSFARRDLETMRFLPGLETTDGRHGIDGFWHDIHRYDKAYFLLPGWDALARLLANHQTPGVVHLVCDEATAAALRGKAAFLRGRSGFRPLHERLDRLLLALDEALDGALLPGLLSDEVRLAPSAVPPYEGEGEPLVLVLTDGRSVPICAGSSVVVYRHDAEPRPFACCPAGKLKSGDIVFLADDDYIALAQRHYLGRCDANALLDPYHRQVLKLRNNIPGVGVLGQARSVLRIMGAAGLRSLPDESTVGKWLDVEKLIGAPSDQVRPHAPHSEEWFLAFTGAIGMLPAQAGIFWQFGIFDTRSRRISAGFSGSRFCKALLTDPESVMVLFDGDNEDLSRLELCARNELVEITSVVKGEKHEH